MKKIVLFLIVFTSFLFGMKQSNAASLYSPSLDSTVKIPVKDLKTAIQYTYLFDSTGSENFLIINQSPYIYIVFLPKKFDLKIYNGILNFCNPYISNSTNCQESRDSVRIYSYQDGYYTVKKSTFISIRWSLTELKNNLEYSTVDIKNEDQTIFFEKNTSLDEWFEDNIPFINNNNGSGESMSLEELSPYLIIIVMSILLVFLSLMFKRR